MSDGFVFGQYFPGESVVHRLDARTKLIGALAAIIIGFCATTPVALAVCVAFVVILYALARIPLRVGLRSIAPLSIIVLITVLLNLLFTGSGTALVCAGPICITDAGVHNAVFFGVRLLVFLAIMCLLTLTTSPLDITDASEALLAPLGRIGVPVHELAMMAGIALRFIPQFAAEFQQIRRAQESRGAHLATSGRGRAEGLSALIVPLFSGVFRRADTLAAAMDARCYRGGVGRTHLHPLRFARRDAVAAVVLVLFLAAVLACSFLA